MAVTTSANVIKATADNDFIQGPLSICGIKVIAAGAATVQIKKKDTSGVILWECSLAAAGEVYNEVEIQVPYDGVWIDLTGTPSIYLYV